MTSHSVDQRARAALRSLAVARLSDGPALDKSSMSDPIAALQALFHLASSSETAPRALALLHELQVHQVELDLQGEQLRSSRADLEAILARQSDLYDYAPVGYFTIDRDTRMLELNLTAARLLGIERGELYGARLDRFLSSAEVVKLQLIMSQLDKVSVAENLSLHFPDHSASPGANTAVVSSDPNGHSFLVAVLASQPTAVARPA